MPILLINKNGSPLQQCDGEPLNNAGSITATGVCRKKPTGYWTEQISVLVWL